MSKKDCFRLLIVDDELPILDIFKRIFGADVQEDDLTAEMKDAESGLFSNTRDTRKTLFSYELTYCQQGKEALDEVISSIETSDPFSVIFLDMRLPPGKDGLWTAEHIRDIDPDVHIVVVTGFSDVEPAELNKKVPPASHLLYIKKPVSPPEIRQMADSLTKHWLDNKKANDAIEQMLSESVESKTKEISQVISSALNEESQDETNTNSQDSMTDQLQDSFLTLKKSLGKKVEELTVVESQLVEQGKELEESKVAMDFIMKNYNPEQIVDEKMKELNNRIMFNILEIAVPYIDKLESTGLNDDQKGYLAILKKNLHELTSPGMRNLAEGPVSFSSSEVKIINLIKHGKSSKEIALLFDLSQEP